MSKGELGSAYHSRKSACELEYYINLGVTYQSLCLFVDYDLRKRNASAAEPTRLSFNLIANIGRAIVDRELNIKTPFPTSPLTRASAWKSHFPMVETQKINGREKTSKYGSRKLEAKGKRDALRRSLALRVLQRWLTVRQ